MAVLIAATLLTTGCGQFSNSSDSDLELQRARQAADAGNVRMAATLYEKVLRQTPDSARPHLELGLLYDEKLSDPIAAIYHYRQYLVLEPNSDRRTTVESYIERSKLTLAAKLPVANAVDLTELTRLQTDKAALMQEAAALRTRVAELERLTGGGSDGPVPPVVPTVVTQRVVIAPVPQPSPPPTPRTYVVQRGDTLYLIAEHFYGTKTGWEKIYNANRTILPSKDQLKVGQQLVIP